MKTENEMRDYVKELETKYEAMTQDLLLKHKAEIVAWIVALNAPIVYNSEVETAFVALRTSEVIALEAEVDQMREDARAMSVYPGIWRCHGGILGAVVYDCQRVAGQVWKEKNTKTLIAQGWRQIETKASIADLLKHKVKFMKQDRSLVGGDFKFHESDETYTIDWHPQHDRFVFKSKGQRNWRYYGGDVGQVFIRLAQA